MSPELRADELGDHIDRLFRAAWALCGSREEAEDLVQDTFAQVLSKRREIDGDALPYLLVVLRNTYVSSIRRRERRPRTTPMEPAHEETLPAPSSRSPLEAVAAKEVFAAVAALPPDQRDVLVAVDVAGLSYAEAAGALDTAIGTVMSRLHRGRARVAERLGPRSS